MELKIDYSRGNGWYISSPKDEKNGDFIYLKDDMTFHSHMTGIGGTYFQTQEEAQSVLDKFNALPMGTLEELDVKPDDHVMYIRGDLLDYSNQYGGTISVVDEYGGTKVHPDGSQGWQSNSQHIFKLISRAEKEKWPHNGEWSNWYISTLDGTIDNSLMRGKECEVEKQKLGKTKQIAYRFRVKPEPKRKTETYYYNHESRIITALVYDDTTHKIKLDTLDGEPVCSSIKMEKL